MDREAFEIEVGAEVVDLASDYAGLRLDIKFDDDDEMQEELRRAFVAFRKSGGVVMPRLTIQLRPNTWIDDWIEKWGGGDMPATKYKLLRRLRGDLIGMLAAIEGMESDRNEDWDDDSEGASEPTKPVTVALHVYFKRNGRIKQVVFDVPVDRYKEKAKVGLLKEYAEELYAATQSASSYPMIDHEWASFVDPQDDARPARVYPFAVVECLVDGYPRTLRFRVAPEVLQEPRAHQLGVVVALAASQVKGEIAVSSYRFEDEGSD